MPKFNPKHNKKITQDAEMGKKVKSSTCSVVGCSETAENHVSLQNIEGFLKELNFTLDPQATKSKRIGLCKTHHKPYKKLKDKEEKASYARLKNFGEKKSFKPDKSHALLE
jgi:hypothetical protein